MMRRLLLATFSLAATTLPLSAQTPNGPVQGAVQGTVKGTQRLARALRRVPDKPVKVLHRVLPASREVLDRRRSELQGALAQSPPRPAKALGAL